MRRPMPIEPLPRKQPAAPGPHFPRAIGTYAWPMNWIGSLLMRFCWHSSPRTDNPRGPPGGWQLMAHAPAA
jgi:hypothetical protein